MTTTLRAVRIAPVTDPEWTLISFLTPAERKAALLVSAREKQKQVLRIVDEVHHKDGNPHNNDIDNLEIVKG